MAIEVINYVSNPEIVQPYQITSAICGIENASFYSNLVNWYKCDETSGTTITDTISALNMTSSVDASGLTDAGYLDTSLNLALTNTLSVGSIPYTKFYSDYTISFYVKMADGRTVNKKMLSYMNGITVYSQLVISAEGELSWNFWDSTNYIDILTGAIFPDGATGWYLVTITASFGGQAIIYVNGTKVGSDSGTKLIGSDDTSDWTLTFGGNYFSGNLDNIMIFDKALSEAEVMELYNCYGQIQNSILKVESGVSGTFTSADAKTITVVNGIITGII